MNPTSFTRLLPLLALLCTASAQTSPRVTFDRAVYEPYEDIVITLEGEPGAHCIVLFDTDPGPTTIPGIGTFQVGFSSQFGAIAYGPLPASGSLVLACPRVCPPPGGIAVYTQAACLPPGGTSLVIGPPAVLRVRDSANYCGPVVCTAFSSNGSNFNGTRIASGNHVWFNAIVKLRDLSGPATVRFSAATITFEVQGRPHVLAVPNSEIVVSPNVNSAETRFDASRNTWRTIVPVGYEGNVFLAGLSYPVATELPGGINPVTWSGEFRSNVPGIEFQWKWAAAVYSIFSPDHGTLGVKPIDGSQANPFPNSDHAGTPQTYKEFVIGGARGGGGSNFTGSYSGTVTSACR